MYNLHSQQDAHAPLAADPGDSAGAAAECAATNSTMRLLMWEEAVILLLATSAKVWYCSTSRFRIIAHRRPKQSFLSITLSKIRELAGTHSTSPGLIVEVKRV